MLYISEDSTASYSALQIFQKSGAGTFFSIDGNMWGVCQVTPVFPGMPRNKYEALNLNCLHRIVQ